MKDRSNDRIIFCKSTQACSSNTTEYVVSSEPTIISNIIHVVVTGEGIASCIQLKFIAVTISEEMQVYPWNSWPPTPQAIFGSSETVKKILLNFIAWIVSPKGTIDRDSLVELSLYKSMTVQQFCENIQAAVPFAQSSLSQALTLFNNVC